MQSKQEKDALTLVFGVVRRDGVLLNVPKVPGLGAKLECTGCTVELSKGLPTQFEMYMTDDQKTQFRTLTGYKARKPKKTTSAIPVEVVENNEG